MLRLSFLVVSVSPSADGDEGSRTVLKTLRARFLAPLGMTVRKGFSSAC